MNENERFEKLAGQFKQETGVWPPGKSMPIGMTPAHESIIRAEFFAYWQLHRWRLVSEELPKKPDKVHVLDIVGRIDTDIYNPEIERWGADVNYTHWMPIAPLEEGE